MLGAQSLNPLNPEKTKGFLSKTCTDNLWKIVLLLNFLMILQRKIAHGLGTVS